MKKDYRFRYYIKDKGLIDIFAEYNILDEYLPNIEEKRGFLGHLETTLEWALKHMETDEYKKMQEKYS